MRNGDDGLVNSLLAAFTSICVLVCMAAAILHRRLPLSRYDLILADGGMKVKSNHKKIRNKTKKQMIL